MHPIVDTKTLETIKGISKALGSYPKPVVAQFGSPIERVYNSARRGIHINSKEVITLTQHKSRLLSTLQQRGFGVVDYRSLESFLYDEGFDLAKFDQVYGEEAVMFLTKHGSIYSEGYSDLIRAVRQLKGDTSGVVFRMDMSPFFRGSVTVMPGLIGTNVSAEGRPLSSGILESQMPADFALTARLKQVAIEAAVSIAADYATIEFVYNEEEALIIDAHTRLQTSTLEAVKAYLRYKTK